MSHIIIPNGYISCACRTGLRDLCRALFRNTNIDMFRYVRAYHDGTYFTLNTDPEFEKFIMFDSGGEYNFDIKFLEAVSSNISFSKTKPNVICAFTEEVDKIGYWNSLFNKFCISSCLSIIEKSDAYYERFGFVSRFGKNFYSFYFNHRDLLDKFIASFKKGGTELLETAEKNKFLWNNTNPKYRNLLKAIKTAAGKENPCLERLQAEYLSNKDLDCNANIKKLITSRQLQCLKYMARGYSYKEIGNELHVSVRTVETHLQHIKNKLGVHSRNQLLKIYHSYHKTT